MIKAKLTGTSGSISSQLDSNEQQLEASLEKSTPQYVGGDGIDIDNGIISNTGVTSINGQTGDLDGFALSAEIPTKTSQLVNDSNYATTNQIPTDYYTQEEVNDLIDNVTVDLSDYYTKTESNDKFADKSEIPTSTSQLTNDSQFITNTVDNLTNYYKKTETYTQAEVNNLIGSITTINFQVVDNLPPTGEANVIYLVPNTQSTNNIYDEYIWVNNSWELIGSTSVDLSNYYTKTETDTKLDTKANTSDLAIVATSGSYDDLTNKPTIPSTTSQLTNDSGYITEASIPTDYYTKTQSDAKYATITSLATVATSGSYNDLTDKPNIPEEVIVDTTMSDTSTNAVQNKVIKAYVDENKGTVESVNGKVGVVVLSATDVNALPNTTSIPTTTSQLTNDSGFITNTADDLTNYYNKTEVDSKVASVYKYKGTVATYSLLPTTGQVIGDTYNVLDSDMNYAWNGETWDALGSSVDLTEYYTKTETDTKLDTKANTSDLSSVATSGSYDDLTDKPTIPSATSQLTNDSGFITIASVPTKTSDLTNDSNFQNATQVTTAINAAIGTTSNLLGDTEDLS